MASHSHHHHHHHPHPHQQHHHQQPPPTCTHCCCCCNPSPTCCTTPPPSPPPQDHHLLQAIASLLSQPHHHATTTIPPTHHHPYHPKSHTLLGQTHNHQHQTHSTISSLLHRVESLESSLLTHHHSLSSSYTFSLRHAAARVIQTHFRSFLARRSRTLRHLKHLALIKSSFISLKSSLSQNTHHHDFPSLSLKAVNLLLQLDSIPDCDSMIVDGKRSIARDLVQFLDSIEGVAVKKMHCVKSAKSGRFGQRVNKSRDSGGRGGDDYDERRKLLQNLRGRVERISRLCKVSENDEEGFEHEGVHNVGGGDGDYNIYDDGGGVANVLISGRNEVFPKKNGVFVQRQGVQPGGKKSVTFAENGKIRVLYSGGGGAYEPDLCGDVVCLDGSTSSGDQGEVLENIGCAVEDAVDSSQGADDDEEALVENGGSPHSSDDGGRYPTRAPKNDGRNVVKGQLQAQQGRILFSAPMPLKMENKAESMKSKGVRILT